MEHLQNECQNEWTLVSEEKEMAELLKGQEACNQKHVSGHWPGTCLYQERREGGDRMVWVVRTVEEQSSVLWELVCTDGWMEQLGRRL